MEKQTQLLLGAAVLGLGGYLYWKSKQPKKMVGANGRIFMPTANRKVFKGADGIFGDNPIAPKLDTGFKGKQEKRDERRNADGTTVPKNFFNTKSSGWLRADGDEMVVVPKGQPTSFSWHKAADGALDPRGAGENEYLFLPKKVKRADGDEMIFVPKNQPKLFGYHKFSGGSMNVHSTNW